MAERKLNLEKPGRIRTVLYLGNLPVAWGHIDADQGKMWLGVAVADGYAGRGYGTKIVKALCCHADQGGFDLWLSCAVALQPWYARHGFAWVSYVNADQKACFMERKSK